MGSGASEIRLRHIRLHLLGCVLGLVNARTPRFLKRLASHAATYNTRTERQITAYGTAFSNFGVRSLVSRLPMVEMRSLV
ncbi:unnamed protein product [Brassica oleracea]|uniref:(rape) hypothetical protein n=1 Tax=Brassica napus TaxID=3708 RepID=A0A816MU64_BRANA|nr:unnamed protein product [Brassica napus]